MEPLVHLEQGIHDPFGSLLGGALALLLLVPCEDAPMFHGWV